MEPIHERGDTEISDYVAVVRRRWRWMVGGVAVAVLLALGISLTKTPVYEANAQLLLQSKPTENLFGASAVNDPARALQNELKIITSKRIGDKVEEVYGSPVQIGAQSGGDDDIIILTASDSDPERAAEKVNVYAETYQTERLTAQVDDLAKARTVIQEQIDSYQQQLDELTGPIADIDAELAALPTTDPRYADLYQEREELVSETNAKRADITDQRDEYQQRLEVLKTSESLVVTGGVQILNPAVVPSDPVSPNPLRDAIQAALIGLFVGMGLGFLADQVDDRVRTAADLERIAKDIPTMGLIPHDESWRNRDESRLSTKEAPLSATAEAFRGLRTSLQYLALQRPLGVLQVTSAAAGEGKSSTLANLAVAFAEAGTRVVVVGCDLRKPRTHRFFDVDPALGLTSYLLGTNRLDECLQRSPIHPDVWVLPSGPRPPNPSELLSLDRTTDLIRGLADDFAIVLLDCPPVLPVTDSLVLARCVDATLFLAMARQTSRGQVKLSFERLRQVSSPLVGTILNGVSAEDTYGSLYDYYAMNDEAAGAASRSRFRRRRSPDVPRLDIATLPGVNGNTPRRSAGTAAPAGTAQSGDAGVAQVGEERTASEPTPRANGRASAARRDETAPRRDSDIANGKRAPLAGRSTGRRPRAPFEP